VLSEANRMHYKLSCPVCELDFEDDGVTLACPRPHAPALLTTRYAARTFECDAAASGIDRYQSWLPGSKRLAQAPRSVTYQSEQLNTILNLPNLWIAFSGYWPERGAHLETATFKELEVSGVLSRISADNVRALVVASAGNTAAAFARACSETDLPCLIVVPAIGMGRMRFAKPLRPCVRIVCLTGAAYADAITFSERIAQQDGFVCEGGVKNIGRRDGMATAMLTAVEAIGKLPDYYFQAIGSGAGAIAAHEASKRLVEDSRFGEVLPRLMLSQNLPFTPIYDSWKRGSREFMSVDTIAGRSLSEQIVASVLSNQRPPYSIAGGMFDVLSESRGGMFAVRNDEVLQALKFFETCERIDIDPAAGVALASLIQAANSGEIDRKATILLHITGGGARKRAIEQTLLPARPDLEISLNQLESEQALVNACALFAGRNACQLT